ncbi:hypothetical protein P5V15_013987 [Pogonomyrmex californicus]
MTAKEVGKIESISKTRKLKEEKQRKIVLEKKEKGESKRVSFRLGCGREYKDEIDKIKRELCEQIEREVKKLKEDRKMYREYLEEIRAKEKLWVERIKNIEDRLEALEKKIERAAEEKEGTEKSEKEVREGKGEATYVGARGSIIVDYTFVSEKMEKN